MKIKILAIFFLLCIILIAIYYKFNKTQKNILLLGENYLLDSYNYVDYFNNNYKINTFFYNKITYKDLLYKIRSNDKKYVKGQDIYLNQLISSADIIILNANNYDYVDKCKKTEKIISNYNNIVSMNINDLYNIIKKISPSKIIVIGNTCQNKKIELSINSDIGYITIDSKNNGKSIYNDIIEHVY